ncbi:unnamed protein product, partial [Scytosiphon promiscuus]
GLLTSLSSPWLCYRHFCFRCCRHRAVVAAVVVTTATAVARKRQAHGYGLIEVARPRFVRRKLNVLSSVHIDPASVSSCFKTRLTFFSVLFASIWLNHYGSGLWWHCVEKASM